MNLKGKHVMVTGGSGFLGRHIVEAFQREGAQVTTPRSREYDLTNPTSAQHAFAALSPEIVVHAAADVGGIGYNQLVPAQIFYNNLMMAGNILRYAAESKVQKLVIIGSACAYPGDVAGDLQESAFMNGPLHPSVECYGFSKRALHIGAKAYHEQYGLNSIFLMLTNLYGPWDKYDPKDSHVVAALIRKFVEAKERDEPQVVCWGTGAPVREFLYVDDCAEAVVRATQRYDKIDPINIGTGVGTTIKELADTLADVVGYQGEVVWDTSRPDGVMRKVLDVTRMQAELGWTPNTSLREGLLRTTEWLQAHQLPTAA